jgi:hypothetical protein
MGARDQIVVVTAQLDVHADDVIRALGRMGEEVIRLNSDDLPLHTAVRLEFDGRWHGELALTDNDRTVDVDRVRSVWWRRPGQPVLPDALSPWEREFARAEIEQVTRGLYDSLDCFWMSHPDAIDRASWKLSQLQRAAALGFEVPRTVVTNDPSRAVRFHAACHGRMVFKVLTGPYLALDRYQERYPEAPAPETELETSTTLVGEYELDQLDGIRTVPTMFQEYVDKAVEYRVIVIGRDVYAAEIESQENQATMIDSRLDPEGVTYRAALLPDGVEELCRRLVWAEGLSFSAIDLVRTPDDRYVFLESNPNGQFRYVEELVPELPLTDAVATALARGGTD